ncbi:hypothetical protein JYU34_014332 [Plutella xylostella]|uniref:Uncharacterized protein n=1 Tax=Plutella xylostella TaxID=51655 RepID=A0ABQ7Q830_PLUXY|nr:uncharacterized protein LOC105380212 isoform X2 [Plutella xylostella]KAG7301392.1 hypothetical protein JYU34_014332 [Plutella xylostella]
MPACTCPPPPQPQHYRGPVLIMHPGPGRERQEIYFGPAFGFELVAEDSGIDSESESRSGGGVRQEFRNFDISGDENSNKSDSDAQSEADGDEAQDSPPLLEVELTASEEEDEGSVLELVIPMQKKGQYRRVPKDEKGERKKQKSLFRRRPFRWMSCCFLPFKKNNKW